MINVNGRLMKIKKILCTGKDNYIIFVKINYDDSLDVNVNGNKYYFKTFNEFTDTLNPIENKAIIITLDDLGYCE